MPFRLGPMRFSPVVKSWHIAHATLPTSDRGTLPLAAILMTVMMRSSSSPVYDWRGILVTAFGFPVNSLTALLLSLSHSRILSSVHTHGSPLMYLVKV